MDVFRYVTLSRSHAFSMYVLRPANSVLVNSGERASITNRDSLKKYTGIIGASCFRASTVCAALYILRAHTVIEHDACQPANARVVTFCRELVRSVVLRTRATMPYGTYHMLIRAF